MNYKRASYLILISVLLYKVDDIIQDTSAYDVRKFTNEQLSLKKWRCFVYYDDMNYYSKGDNEKYKYIERSCKKYKYDYINFMLEKSNILFYNLIKKISVYILIIYLYINMV